MTEVNNTASVETVGDVASSFVVQTRCFRPSAQPLPLICPHHFCFRNIKYPNAFFSVLLTDPLRGRAHKHPACVIVSSRRILPLSLLVQKLANLF